MNRLLLPLIAAISLFAAPLHAFTEAVPPEMRVDVISEATQVKPGETVLIGVHFHIEELWHIYWKTAGDSGIPTTIRWTVPNGVTVSDLRWPEPHVFDEEGDIRTAGYKDETVLLAALTIPTNWPAGKAVDIKADAKWLVCKVACVPGGASAQKKLLVGADRINNDAESAILQEYLKKVPSAEVEARIVAQLKHETPAASVNFGLALLFAFIGGLLLNVMPCVLPVLSIKVFRLLKHKDQPRNELVTESLTYAAGVLLSFALLAGVVIFLKSIGQEIGWGFQFQEPRFVIALAGILFVSGLVLAGGYEFSVWLPASVSNKVSRGGPLGALWDGFLATLLATPCTAPFLGVALGFSFSQPPLIIFLFFVVIGVGLALPYVLFALLPGTTRILPKPGTWMEVFKELMGFPLLGTAIWLLWILGQQQGPSVVASTLVFFLILSLALWGTKRWTARSGRWFFILLVVVTYMAAVEPLLQTSTTASRKTEGRWKPYSAAAVKEELANGKTVFVDFTADWCLTCQLNKRVLHSDAAVKAFDETGVVTMLADWTSRSEEITHTLRSFGRSGVPVYALYTPGQSSPTLLPELLTESVLVDALKKQR
jgi:thiol:disulfide interchange protein